MKTLNTLMASALMIALAPAALAASTVDLSVTGKIVPTSCTPSLSQGDVSFGKLSAKDLDLDKPTRIGGYKAQNLTIDCQAATLFGIRGIDNRKETVGNTWYMTPYGLGVTGKGEKIGAHYLELRMAASTIDGKPAFVTVGNADGTSWGASTVGDQGIRNYGPLLGLNATAGATTGPIAIKTAVLGLTSYIVVAPAKTLTLDEEVALDGSATIEVVYL